MVFAVFLLAAATDPCRITVLDEGCDWPVPLVELRTTDQQRFVTDNAGVVAFDDPASMGREVWLSVRGHGYGVERDDFGFEGVRVVPEAGGSLVIRVKRRNIARRVGRSSGSGLFAESRKLGDQPDPPDELGVGRDSVQLVVDGDRLLWLWGDTSVRRYPLGVFHMTGGWSDRRVYDRRPPLRPRFDFLRDQGQPRPLAEMPGPGPTWLTAVAALPDTDGRNRVVATYRKIKPPLTTSESGLCEFDEDAGRFVHLETLWSRDSGRPEPHVLKEGHSVRWVDADGQSWLLIGNPLPHTRVPASYESWRDLTTWQPLSPQATIASSDGPMAPHSGSIAWSEDRRRWVAVITGRGEGPAPLSDVWYAEADSPLGPWGPAVRVLSHDDYSFYNPRLLTELEAGPNVLLFEGTYSATFAAGAEPTPRYDYNQIVYRLDLDDACLAPARAEDE